MTEENHDRGKVYLVGAGPGDGRLLTLRGRRLLNKADIVLYDRLIDPSLPALFSPQAKKIYVGKSPGEKHFTQKQINNRLLEAASRGLTVVRLKGGDPFIFGRGSEEAAFLIERGIEVEVIPGITSVTGVPEVAGIPLTRRGNSSSFHVFSGHAPSKLNYRQLVFLAEHSGTLVFVMAMKNIGSLISGLLKEGVSSSIPAAVIQQGTTAAQKMVSGKLNNLEELVTEEGLTSPALIIIGEVVPLREKGKPKKINGQKLKSKHKHKHKQNKHGCKQEQKKEHNHNHINNEYNNQNQNQYQNQNNKPLSGKRILVPRPRESGSDLKRLINEAGGEVFHYPLIEFKGPRLSKENKKMLHNAGRFDWLIFSSSRGVKYFFEAFKKLQLDIRRLSGIQIAALGPAVVRSLEKNNLFPDFIPQNFNGRSFVEEFCLMAGRRRKLPAEDEISSKENRSEEDETKKTRIKASMKDIGKAKEDTAKEGKTKEGKIGKSYSHKKKVLFPRSSRGRKELTALLLAKGFSVNELQLYDTEFTEIKTGPFKEHIKERPLDLLLFTSPSTVKSLARIIKPGSDYPGNIPAVCIGPVTAASAKKYGFHVVATAETPTAEKIIEKTLNILHEEGGI